jgi:MoxR-like ATPase
VRGIRRGQVATGQRKTVQRCFTAAASQYRVLLALQEGTAQGVVEAAFSLANLQG